MYLLFIVPATIVCAVECAYPIPEEASVGVLYMSGYTFSIATTFIGQVFLQESNNQKAPFFPGGIWFLSTLIFSIAPALLFNGKYLRFEQDSSKHKERFLEENEIKIT